MSAGESAIIIASIALLLYIAARSLWEMRPGEEREEEATPPQDELSYWCEQADEALGVLETYISTRIEEYGDKTQDSDILVTLQDAREWVQILRIPA